MGFTAEQQSAIDLRDSELLVSAAAGSGKTAVLVERIIKLIISDGIDIDRLLVVTFTEAAANEMRSRISERLHELQMLATDDDNIRQQLMLLPHAQISTIHKFCVGVIRRYFHLIELDPGFRVADETETQLLKSQVLDDIFEEHYDGDDGFFELVDYYGGGKTNDRGLYELVFEISEFVSGFPWPQRWLMRVCEMYNLKEGVIDATPWAHVLRFELKNRLEGALALMEYGMKLAALGADKYLDALAQDMDTINLLRLSLRDLSSFRKELFAVEFKDLRRFSAKDNFSPETKERVQNLRNHEIKPAIKDLCKLFVKPMPDMESDVRELYHIIKSLIGLVMEFITRFSEAKRHKNIVDFNDLEHFALKILYLPESDETNPIFSETAIEIRENYAEVMIDEYQDSNLVQELVLSAVALHSRFLVGDVKQSIYKFRGAKPELFIEKLMKRGKGSSLIALSKNFRSRECVINTVNLFFSRLMTKDSEIDYDADAGLYYGANYPDAGNLSVADNTEIYIIDGETDEESETDLSRIDLEAITIAERINELVDSLYIYDRNNNSYRKAMYKDIVILLRSLRGGVAESFLDILKKYGIPVFTDNTTGYFNSIEVMTMLCFLQITDNPRQDIQLLAVLRSPVYGLTDEELLVIRGAGENSSFYDCVREYVKQGDGSPALKKLEKFLIDLKNFRRSAIYLSIIELIDYIDTSTDYFNYVGAMPDGAVRQANLRMLRDKAMQFEQTSYRGLFNFISYMQKVKERSDEGSAKVFSENANVVRIITVHKSKGLEFPVVFLSMLGRRFSRQDERGNVVLHSELGIGTIHIDLDRRIRSNTLPRMAAMIQLHRESMAEEIRVLYVAFTRAREKLILTGSVINLAKAREKWQRHEINGKLPSHVIFGASSRLDWLMPVIYSASNVNDVKVYYRNLSDFIAKEEREGISDADMHRKKMIKISDESSADVIENLEWTYPLKDLAGLPAKLSISEIKRLHNRGQDSMAMEYMPALPVYLPPRFLQGKAAPTSTGRGTVMHTVLEHIDMTFLNNADDLRALVLNLVDRRILTKYEAGMVDYPALEIFCHSDICRRIINAAPDVWRETPFVLGLTPYQIYKNEQFFGIDTNVLVHGIIDCYFEENGQLVLVDYKTGNKANIDEYGVQMAVYKLALERATGKQVGECLLYLFSEGRAVNARLAEIV